MSNRRNRRALVLLAASLAAVVWWAAPSGARVVPQATVELVNVANEGLGTVTFLGRGGHATEIRVELDLPSGAPGLNAYHGLHVHELGACTPTFAAAGTHWKATGQDHGQHLGDLPSVLVGADGEAALTADVPRFAVDQLVGRSVILHELPDNFGRVPVGSGATDYDTKTTAEEETKKTGNSGPRYGCGVIEAAGNA